MSDQHKFCVGVLGGSHQYSNKVGIKAKERVSSF